VPASAEAQQRRRSNRRRASNAQAARQRAARAAQQRRLRNQQAARRNRAVAAQRARMAAQARANYNRQAAAARASAGRANANLPVIVYKDYQLQLGENVNVSSLTPLGRKATVEDVAVGQTVSLTLVKEQTETGKTAAPGQLTGLVVKVETNSVAQELTVRVASYQVGGKAGETTTIPVPDVSVTGIVIRSRAAANVAGLFKQ
jgi:hypothetical protein